MGMAKVWPPQLTSSNLCVAIERGTERWRAVPQPSAGRRSTSPCRRRTASYTTESPMPRPDRSVTEREVENPARKRDSRKFRGRAARGIRFRQNPLTHGDLGYAREVHAAAVV